MPETTVEAQGEHAADNAKASVSKEKRSKRLKIWQKTLLIIAIILVVLLAAGGISVAVLLDTGKNELLASNDTPYAYRKIKVDGKR